MADDELIGTPVPGRPDLLKISREPELVVPNPHHSTRTKARKQALDMLFEAELRDRDLLVTLDEHVATGEPPVREFAQQIIRGIDEHMGEIDERIAECTSRDWSMERMPRVDRNLCRIAVWEIDHTSSADEAVIGEAVALATEFSTEDSAAFVNGVLAQVARTKSERVDTLVEPEPEPQPEDDDEDVTDDLQPFGEGLSFDQAAAGEH